MIHLILFTIFQHSVKSSQIQAIQRQSAIRAQQDNNGAGESLCVAGFYDSTSRKTEEKNTNQICSRIKWKLEEQIKVQRKERTKK